jgi:hypothetical protein
LHEKPEVGGVVAVSYCFQGSLVRGNAASAGAAFDGLQFSVALRLCCFSEQVYGVYTVEPVSWDAFVAIVRRLSEELGAALHYYYNSISGESICLFERGELVRRFSDEADAIWVETDEQGGLLRDGPQYRDHQRPLHLHCDYLRAPLDAALEAIGERSLSLRRDSLYLAFFASGSPWIRESSPVQQGRTGRRR